MIFLSLHPRRSSMTGRVLLLALFAVSLLVTSAGAQAPRTAPQLTKPPALVKFVEAPYPNVEPKPAGDVGVTMTILIKADGKVGDVTVTQSGGAEFDAAAVAAVKSFEFSPAEVDNKPSDIRIEYRYVFTLRQEPLVPTTGVLAGNVFDADSKKPLANVKVTIEGGATVVTDAAGHFRVDGLTPGRVGLTLAGERLTPLSTEENVVAGEELEVTYRVGLQPLEGQSGPSDDMEILVMAPPALKREAVSTKVTAEEARSVPGAQGDVLRVVESLPGVARAAVGSGNLVVWGAGPDDTRTYVDGVPIPSMYHVGGLRSTVYSGVVNSVELVPGGYGAAYGRGLGGLIRVDTQTPDKAGLHGTLSADALDSAAMLSHEVGPRMRATATARVSLIDQLATALHDDVKQYVPIPRYRDAQLRTAYKLKGGGTLDVVGMLSFDHTARGVPNSDPALQTHESRDSSFYRIYANYKHEAGDGTRTVVTPYVGAGTSTLKTLYGATETALSDDDFTAGLRASHAIRVTPSFTIEGGLDVQVESHRIQRRGSLGLPAREGDIRIFNQPPPDSVGFDKFKTQRIGVAPYIEGDLALFGEKLHIVPGLRVDPMFRSVSRKVPQVGTQPAIGAYEQNFAVEPRLAVRLSASRRLNLHAATGIYHQQPAVADLSATFGNPLLPISRSVQTVLGARVQASDTLSVELTGFASVMSDLTMRNTAAAPLNAEALLATGRGKAFGIQTMIRRELSDHVFGWVAYTLQRSERKNAPNTHWRLFDYDQTHVLSTVLVYTPFKGFEVGARFRVTTGYPRTPVVGTYEDAGRNRVQPIFGKQNSIRIPVFAQLDLRASQTFELKGTQLMIYLEVQNVTNRKNQEELVYSPDFGKRDGIRSLPILPVAGLSWNF
ncbi:MAG: TonB family protein / TonB-dependent receptor [Myxococcaceae bacterium]|nr:TonB family protein / TonB-dependent receptor [Myxococcaceae bacterium]